MRRKPMRTQYSAPPTHSSDLLAHHQSEYPMAQTADSQPPQTSLVESEQTTSEWRRKPLTQLNTPNIFVSDLVRISPNASDVQQLGRCVPALTTHPPSHLLGQRTGPAIINQNKCHFSQSVLWHSLMTCTFYFSPFLKQTLKLAKNPALAPPPPMS